MMRRLVLTSLRTAARCGAVSSRRAVPSTAGSALNRAARPMLTLSRGMASDAKAAAAATDEDTKAAAGPAESESEEMALRSYSGTVTLSARSRPGRLTRVPQRVSPHQ